MSQQAGPAPKGAPDGPNAEALQSFMDRAGQGPVVMLNLLKFKAAGGAEMYARYGEAVAPLLRKCGGRVLYMGQPDELVIGRERWDSVLLVEYPSRGAFIGMVTSPEYQAIQHLRDESLERSVLYATNPLPTPAA